MNTYKIITVVAGISGESIFNYSCYIVENLSQLLPNFAFKKVTKKSDTEWKIWLKDICTENKWTHTESLLVWRETGICGGKPTYIGGYTNFKQFINKYYGIDVVLDSLEQKKLDVDYSKAQKLETEEESETFKSDIIYVTISGAGRTICPDLVGELATMKEISEGGISISLYDTPGHFFKIKDIVKDACAIGCELRSIKMLEKLSDGLKYCDILIVLDHLIREDLETTEEWLQRCYDNTKEMAEQVNQYAPSKMKIIFCSMGPTCFCANVMAREAPKINRNQIVAVSAQYGLELINELVKSSNFFKQMEGIACPPVWGFLGINQYADVFHTLKKCTLYVPNKRALTASENCSLPLGVRYAELRWMFYLAHNKNLHASLADRKALGLYQTGRIEDFQKCKAICDLLKFWYEKDETKIGDEIISLGISSDGSFGVPKDIYFSQPVYLKILDDNTRIWVPCTEFPVPFEISITVNNFTLTAKSILQSMDLLDNDEFYYYK